MNKVFSLRNIITIFTLLFFISCNKQEDKNSSTISVKTYSSEDKYTGNAVGSIKDPETGEVICIIKRK